MYFSAHPKPRWSPTCGKHPTTRSVLTDRSLDPYNLGARTRLQPLLRKRDVDLTLRVKLCGRGLRAEADAARRSPPLTLMRLRTACRRDSSELTSRLGRRAEAGPHLLLRGVRPRPMLSAGRSQFQNSQSRQKHKPCRSPQVSLRLRLSRAGRKMS